MTLEESREVIPMLEDMINHIEEQQSMLAEMYQVLQERDMQLLECQEQNDTLLKLNNELQQQLEILPSTEEMLQLLSLSTKVCKFFISPCF